MFYSQRRVGCDGRIFTVHKLRSMCADAERDTGPVWATGGGDARVTPHRPVHAPDAPRRAAAVLEHPDRPHEPGRAAARAARVRAVAAQQIPFYGQRHVIKPGLTGWAQVRYTYGATVEDAIEKLQYDLFYIKHCR